MAPPMLFEKQFDTHYEKAVDAENALASINKFAPEAVAAADVYTFRAVLANDRYDRSHERFTVDQLHRFRDTLVGKSILPGHDKKALPLGKWFGSDVRANPDGSHDLLADGYLPAESAAARLVALGIAKDVSIGYRASARTCDLCGKDYDDERQCRHKAGHSYDGALARVTYSGDLAGYEAREGSLVWLGCQYGAQVDSAKAAADEYAGRVLYKAADLVPDPAKGDERMTEQEKADFDARGDEVKVLKAKVAELEPKASAGDAYFGSLKDGILAKAKQLGDDVDIYTAALAGTNLESLKKWDEALQKRFDEKFPPNANALMLGAGAQIAPEHGAPNGGERKSFVPFAGLKGGS